MLHVDLEAHLANEKHQKTTTGNYRNGHGRKKIKSSFGESQIQVPRDREGSFEPVLVRKRHNIIEGLENIITSFYAKGMIVSDIEEQIKELYNLDVSTSAISRINALANEVIAWQSRPLKSQYLIIWFEAMVFKVREGSKVIDKTIYLAVGLNLKVRKEVMGMWLGKNESSSFSMGVLTDLKARGVEDIFITASDNLNGFTQTIPSVFPESQTQISVVHHISRACTYVLWKDRKEFSSDMRHISYRSQ